MVHLICAVYDSKVAAYFPPFFVRHEAMAQRWFLEQCGNEQHDFHKFPEDYTLFELGSFDDVGAKWEIYATPHAIITALVARNVSMKADGSN